MQMLAACLVSRLWTRNRCWQIWPLLSSYLLHVSWYWHLSHWAVKLSQPQPLCSFLRLQYLQPLHSPLQTSSEDVLCSAHFLLVVAAHVSLDMLWTMHDDATTGQLGSVRTLHHMQKHFFWPQMHHTVHNTQPGAISASDTSILCTPHPSELPSRSHRRFSFWTSGHQPPQCPFPYCSDDNIWVTVCTDHLLHHAKTTAVPAAPAAHAALLMFFGMALLKK